MNKNQTEIYEALCKTMSMFRLRPDDEFYETFFNDLSIVLADMRQIGQKEFGSMIYRGALNKIIDEKQPVCPSRYTHVIENADLKLSGERSVTLENQSYHQLKQRKAQEEWNSRSKQMMEAAALVSSPFTVFVKDPDDKTVILESKVDLLGRGLTRPIMYTDISIEDAPPGEPGTLRADEGFANAMVVGNRRSNTDFKWKG